MVKKIKRGSIVKNSAIIMAIMGVAIGLAFIPFSVYILHLSKSDVYSFKFLVSTITAGLSVGAISFIIIQLTIIKKLKDFEENIEMITSNIFQYQLGKVKSINECENCYLKIFSQDIIGRIAIKYNSLIRIIRGQFWQHEVLEEFSTKISTINFIDEVNKITVDFLGEKLDLLGVEIYTILSGEVKLSFSRCVSTTLTPQKQKSLLDIMEKGKHISIKQHSVEIVEYGTGSIKPKEINYFPIKHAHKTWLFVIYTNYTLSKERKSLIEKILNEYKFAYESAEMYEKLQKVAAYDELTGIYNRNFGMKRLQDEYKRALRTGSTLCLIMFDIDHFKSVNDTYGHQAGDYILASFGKILRENFRTEDVILRYGGEEFLCVMENSTDSNGIKKANTIREIVEKSKFEWNNVEIKITVSGGVYALTPSKENLSIQEAIKKADEALYQAKNNGRNRIIKYASL